MTDSNNHPPEDAAEQALRAGLRAPGLSPDALRRIRAATHEEWRAVHARDSVAAPARRRWLPLAAAATVAMVAMAIGWNVFLTQPPQAGALLGELTRFDAPGMVESRFFRSEQNLARGSPLRPGQSLDVRGDSLVSLAGGGNLRVARASAMEVMAADTVKLVRGELYVDIPPGTRASDTFRVVTPAGEFLHVGTQFGVAIVNGATRLRVREGSVSWHANDGESTVDAGTEVLIDRNRRVTWRPISTAGRDWAWAESLAPDVEIENRPLQEFLEWFSRETGRKLVMNDDAARRQVAAIRMHGNVHGLTAMEALSAVMSATTLRFELPEGMIRVSSARESTIPPS